MIDELTDAPEMAMPRRGGHAVFPAR